MGTNESEVFRSLVRAALSSKIKASHFRTLFLIWYDCWNGVSFQWSEKTTIPILAKIYKLHRGTLWRHIKFLEDEGWIKMRYVDSSVIRIKPRLFEQNIGDRDFATVTDEASRNRVEEEALIINNVINRDSSTSNHFRDRRRRENATEENKDIEQYLISRNVFPSVRKRIIELSHISLDYIQAHFDYVDLRKDQGIGMAVSRIYANDPVPEYCKLCGGLEGNHRLVDTDNYMVTECPVSREGKIGTDEINEIYGNVRKLP